MSNISVTVLKVTLVLKLRLWVMSEVFLVQPIMCGELACESDWNTSLLGSCILKKTNRTRLEGENKTRMSKLL